MDAQIVFHPLLRFCFPPSFFLLARACGMGTWPSRQGIGLKIRRSGVLPVLALCRGVVQISYSTLPCCTQP